MRSSSVWDITFPDGVAVSRRRSGPRALLVVAVRDAHGQPSFQWSVAGVVQWLVAKHEFRFVSVEGATGLVDTSLFASFPVASVRQSLAEAYVKTGKISGVEYASVTTGGFTILGAEDALCYLKAIEVAKHLLPGSSRETLDARLAQLGSSLLSVSRRLLTPSVLEMAALRDKMRKEHPSGRFEFASDHLLAHGVPKNRYHNVHLAAAMDRLERRIDWDLVGPARRRLVGLALGKLTASDQRSALRVLYSPCVDHCAERTVLERCIDVADKHLLTEEEARVVALWAEYRALAGELDLLDCDDDFEAALLEILLRHCDSDDQRVFVALTENIDVLGRMLQARALRRHIDHFYQLREDFTGGVLMRQLRGLERAYGGVSGTAALQDLVAYLPVAEAFYSSALRRGAQLAESTLGVLSEQGVDRVVMVSGGFHTRAAVEVFEREGVGYVLVLPRSKGPMADQAFWRELLLDERTPFLDYFRGKRGGNPESGHHSE